MKTERIDIGTAVLDNSGRGHIVRGVQSISCESELTDIDQMIWRHYLLVTFLIEEKTNARRRGVGVVTRVPQNGLITLSYGVDIMLQFGGMLVEPIVETFNTSWPPVWEERLKIMIHPSGMVHYGYVGRIMLDAARKLGLARQGVLYA